MKKILIALAFILLCTNFTFALDDIQTSEQKIENEKSHAGINFQKAPGQNCAKQNINNKGSWFNINIIINGKPFKFNSDSDKNGK